MANQKIKSALYHVKKAESGFDTIEAGLVNAKMQLPRKYEDERDVIMHTIAETRTLMITIQRMASILQQYVDTDESDDESDE